MAMKSVGTGFINAARTGSRTVLMNVVMQIGLTEVSSGSGSTGAVGIVLTRTPRL